MGFSVALYYLGNYEEAYSMSITIPLTFVSAFGFALLGQLPFMNNSLATIRSWPWQAWLVYASGLAVILAFAGYHFFQAYEEDILVTYAISLLILILQPIPLYFLTPDTFHPHHWYIFYVLCYYSRFNTVPSQIAAGLCLGIYVQGTAQYVVQYALTEPITATAAPSPPSVPVPYL